MIYFNYPKKVYLKYKSDDLPAKYLNINNRPAGSGCNYHLKEDPQYFELNKTKIRNKRINVDLFIKTWNHGPEFINIRNSSDILLMSDLSKYNNNFEGKPIKSIKIKAANNKVTLLYKNGDNFYEAIDKYDKKPIFYTDINIPINIEYNKVLGNSGSDIDNFDNFALKIEENYD